MGVLDVDAGVAEAVGVGDALRAERIEPAGDDVAGGRPPRSAARSGEASGSAPSAGVGRYCSQNQSTSARVRSPDQSSQGSASAA